MQLEKLMLVLRFREGREAVDLGLIMAQHWYKVLCQTLLVVIAPFILITHVLFWDKLIWAFCILWWLKPVYDRALLFVVSRAAFGQRVSPYTIWSARKLWLWPGLWIDLSWHRFSLSRSFMLPVWILEQLRGRAGRSRRQVLGKRGGSTASELTLMCAVFWMLLFAMSFVLVAFLVPVSADVDPSPFNSFLGLPDNGIGQIGYTLLFMLALFLTEPFYVCAGFALYLNRRLQLEGWDVELSLRQLTARLQPMLARGASTLVILAMVLSINMLPDIAMAQTPSTEQSADNTVMRQQIKQILSDPVFGGVETVREWIYIADKKKDSATDSIDMKQWEGFFRWVAEFVHLSSSIVQALLWGLVIALAIYLAIKIKKYLPRWIGIVPSVVEAPPTMLFGQVITPESLPDNLAMAAQKLAEQKQYRAALSLLYRGSLSCLVHQHRLQLKSSMTEGDCLGMIQQQSHASLANYFDQLVHAWRITAYAGQQPSSEHVLNLCRSWSGLFLNSGNIA